MADKFALALVVQSRRRHLVLAGLLYWIDVAMMALGFSQALGLTGLIAALVALACLLPATKLFWRAWLDWRRAVEALIDDDYPRFI